MSWATFLIALGSVCLTALAQVALRAAMVCAPTEWSTASGIKASTLALATNRQLIAGFALYAVSILLWLVVLSRSQVGSAYPLTSIGYVLTAFFAYAALGETVPQTTILGIVVISIGVVLVAWS